MNHNFVLRIAYEGTGFFGWQKTSTGPSVEEALESCLHQILQFPIALQAASRTDRGVHAEEQWVNFLFPSPLDLEGLQYRLNALLPLSIRVLSIQELPLSFHPTLHALAKEYQYQICYAPLQMPWLRHFSWHVPSPLDLERMREASLHFLGTHDFSSFCNHRKNLNYKDKKREIEEIRLLTPDENRLLIFIKGNHFLYKMVRNIVGTLVYVGRGKIEPAAIPAILTAGARKEAGITAPAYGLTLKKIYYPYMITPYDRT